MIRDSLGNDAAFFPCRAKLAEGVGKSNQGRVDPAGLETNQDARPATTRDRTRTLRRGGWRTKSGHSARRFPNFTQHPLPWLRFGRPRLARAPRPVRCHHRTRRENPRPRFTIRAVNPRRRLLRKRHRLSPSAGSGPCRSTGSGSERSRTRACRNGSLWMGRLPGSKPCATLLLLLGVGARGQVLERLVSLQDAAAGSFPSGKLLPASDGNFYGTTEVGGSGGWPHLSHRSRGHPLLHSHS